MADILAFPVRPRGPCALRSPPGSLVAMRHVDLDEAVETVLLLRESGSPHLLDDFNRGPPRRRFVRREAAG